MRSRLVSPLLVASLVVPAMNAMAQACLAVARPMFLTGPAGDSIEIVNPSLVALRDGGVMIAGAGATVFKDGPAVVEPPLRIVRVRGNSTVSVDGPREFGRYLFPRLADDASGAIHLLWAEPDSALTLPKERRTYPEVGIGPSVIWSATYRDGRWTRAIHHGRQYGLMWHNATPTRAAGRYSAIAAVSHAGRPDGLIDIYFADGERSTTRTLKVGGPPVYSSVAPLKDGVMVAFIAGSSGGERRSVNTVFITDSLATDTTWSTPVALGVRGDHPATAVSLVPNGEGGANAVWGQSLTGALTPDVVRIVPLDARGRPLRPAQDLGGDGGLMNLHAERDRRGGTHIVYQRHGDDATMTYYAHWSPRSGWSKPAALSGARHSRDPAIVAQSNDSLVIAFSAIVGMTGVIPRFGMAIPRFATAILRVGTGSRCAP